ncbi:MAG: CPBP family intramembrane metalloprotease [Lachnospiraceae bacterium]|nr:CPBP family intramembrane metalloprotease [Lachnospiraceae bacterium]
MITVLAVITAVGSVAAPGSIFAYAYMKTENIWVPVILHFMNNNLIPIISGEYDISVLENQTTTWASLIPALILNGIIFGLFLFAKEFRKENE